MTKKMLIVTAFLFLILSGITYAQQSPTLSIKTVPAPKGNWVYLPEGDGKFEIHVSTEYANRLKVWKVPTGTQQWENRILICDQGGNKNDWTCIWSYTKDETIHHHFFVEVSGESGSATDIINVTRRHTKDHPQ